MPHEHHLAIDALNQMLDKLEEQNTLLRALLAAGEDEKKTFKWKK